MKISLVARAVILSRLKAKCPELSTRVLEKQRGWIQDAGTTQMSDPAVSRVCLGYGLWFPWIGSLKCTIAALANTVLGDLPSEWYIEFSCISNQTNQERQLFQVNHIITMSRPSNLFFQRVPSTYTIRSKLFAKNTHRLIATCLGIRVDGLTQKQQH